MPIEFTLKAILIVNSTTTIAVDVDNEFRYKVQALRMPMPILFLYCNTFRDKTKNKI